MSDLRIKLIAEVDESSIGNITKQLETLKESAKKIKIDIETGELMSKLNSIESKFKPIDLKVDTSKATAAVAGLVSSYDKVGSSVSKVSDTTTKLNGVTQDVTKRIVDSTNASGQLLKSTQNVSAATGEISKEVTKVTTDYKKQRSEVEKLQKIQSKSLWGQSKDILDNRVKVPDGLKEMGKYYKDLEKSSQRSAKTVEKSNQQISKSLWGQSKEILDGRTRQSDELKKMGVYYKDLEKSSASATKSTNTFGSAMGNVLKRAVGWVSLTMVIRKAFRAIGQGVKSVKELDSAMVELKKVSSATSEEYSNFLSSAFDTGRMLGQTGTEVVNATADFARMGFELKQSSELAKEALLMVNVGDGVDSVDQATKAMITALKGFKVEGKDSVEAARHINDAYNEVANNFAIDTSNIAEGVRRSSAIMAASGNDIDQTIGLITGGFEVMQDSSKISSGLNIIAQRLKGINDEGKKSPELVAKLKDEFKDIANINLEQPNGELKDTYTILEELATVYPDLSDKQRAYLAELTAGKRQAVVLESIMSNWENVAKATDTARSSAGSAMRENEIYMDSIEGKMGVLKATAEEFWTTLINTSAVKGFIDAGSSIMGVITDMVKSFKGSKDNINIDEIMKGHGEGLEYLKDVQKEFDYLTTLVGKNGDLSAMSEEQKNRYLDMVQQLKATSPELETFYNTQGDMVASTRTEIEKLIKAKEAEMKLDKEKSSEGFNKRINEHKKENEVPEKYLKGLLESKRALEKEINDGTSKNINESIKTLEQVDAKIDKVMADTKKRIDETMSSFSPKISLMGDEIEALKPHVENITEGIREMLEQDSSNEGLDKAVKAMDILEGTYKNIQATIDDGGILPSVSDMKEDIKAVTDLGMSYDIVASSIYKTMAVAKNGEEDIGKLDAAMKNFNETGKLSEDSFNGLKEVFPHLQKGVEAFSLDFIKQIGKTDEATAAYLATMQEVDNGIESLTKNIEKHVKGINVKEVIDSKGIAKEFDEVEKASKNTIRQIELDSKEHQDILEYMYKDLGILTQEQYAEATKNNSDLAKKRLNDEKQLTSNLEAEIIKRGESSRKQIADAIKGMDDETKSFNDVWNSLGKDEQKLILDYADVTEGEKGWESLVNQWMHTPEAKRLTVIDDGIEFALANIDQLGVDWQNVSSEDKVFIAEVLGVGLDEFEDFEKTWGEMSEEERRYHLVIQSEGIEETEEFKTMWDGMSDEEQTFFINLEGKGIEDVKAFVKEWESLSDDERKMKIYLSTIGEGKIEEVKKGLDSLGEEDKKMLITVLTEGAEDADAFQKKWNALTPEEKKFIAKSVGIEDVENADEKTMNSWAISPEVKLFQAMQNGLENVRVERSKTDGVWNVKIGDKTYTTNEQGANRARAIIKQLQDFWSKIPRNDTKTKTTNINTHYRETRERVAVTSPTGAQTGVTRWTGDSNFQGGLSYVGEKGRELLVYPDGSHDMTGDRTELRNLPRGTKIYNNRDTEDILAGKKIPKFGADETRKILKGSAQSFAKGNAKAKSSSSSSDSARADIYEYINSLLSKQGNLIAKNNALQAASEHSLSRTIKYIQEEISLEKKHVNILNSKKTLQRKERDSLKKQLSREGFRFAGSGDNTYITNLKKIEGKNKDIEEKFNRFNELQLNLIPNITVDILEAQNKIKGALSRGFEKQTRVDNDVKEISHLIEMNKIYQDREIDGTSKKLSLMKEEISLLERKAKLGRTQQGIYIKERQELEKILRSRGFLFSGKDNDRRITNPANIKGEIKEIEDALNRYNEIQFDILPKLVIDGMGFKDEVDGIKNAIESAIINLNFETSDAEVDRLNKKIARSLENNLMVQRKDDPYWDLVANEGALGATKEKSSYQYNKGWDYLNQAKQHKEDSENFKILNDKAQEYFKASRDADLEIFELKTKVHEAKMRYLDEELKSNVAIQDTIKFRMDMLEDDDIKGKIQLQKEFNNVEIKNFELLNKKVKELNISLQAVSPNTDEWHVLNNSLDKYNQQLRDATLEVRKQRKELIATEKELAELNFEGNLSKLELAIFGGQTEKDAKESLDNRMKAYDDFIDGEERLLEIERIKKLVADENLTLTKEQLRLLESGDRVERAKLDKLNKQLNIQQLQERLESLKGQKNIQQLVKNDDGTFNFQYVADENAIKEVENEIIEGKKELVKWEYEYRNEQDKKSFEERQALLQKEEEKLRKRLDEQLKNIEALYKSLDITTKTNISSFDTGGKTGNFQGGRVALLHEKEIVLNKSQSETFEKLVNIMPNITNVLGSLSNGFKGIKPIAPKLATQAGGTAGTQNFNISKLEFPNVKDAREIENSIKNLSTFATQWANKK